MNPSRMTRDPITIAGVSRSDCVAEDPRSIPEIVLCAVQEALTDAALNYDDIDAVVTASVDLFDGLTASNIAVTEVVGAVMRPETRIATDSLGAVLHAACQIWAGAYETVLVAAHGKASMTPYDSLTNWAMDPIYLQPLDVDFLMCSALQAQALAEKDARIQRRWAERVAERRQCASDHGIAPPCSAEEVLDSPFIASPLRREMRAPLGDGAYAVVLRKSEETSTRGSRIGITGVGHDLSAHGVWETAPDRWEGLRRAKERAYHAAGLDGVDPGIDLFEPSCFYPHEEDLFIDACEVGDDASLSPTGGLYSGVAPVTAGLSRLITATRLMRKNTDIRRALAHGAWGPAGQGHVVAILEAQAA